MFQTTNQIYLNDSTCKKNIIQLYTVYIVSMQLLTCTDLCDKHHPFEAMLWGFHAAAAMILQQIGHVLRHQGPCSGKSIAGGSTNSFPTKGVVPKNSHTSLESCLWLQ
jgi:hypothetical protein